MIPASLWSSHCCKMACTQSPEQREQRMVDRQIQEELNRDKAMQKKTHKLLLLGTGDSGKTTFVKQMKILYGGGFEEKEYATYKVDIMNNLVDGMNSLVVGMEMLGIEWAGGEAMISLARDMMGISHRDGSSELGPGVGFTIKRLWEDAGIKEVFARRGCLQINDSVGFFLDNMARITEEGYRPTEQDILFSRKQTTGVVEHSFTIEDDKFVLVDVGGQRSERRKWIHHFEHVTAVVFLVAVSEYDQLLWEDTTVNRMEESRNLFSNMLENEYFKDTSFILFLNKKDIFEEKIKTSHLKTYFPRFDGSKGNPVEAMKFIKAMYHQERGRGCGKIYPFDTIATDKTNIERVFRSVKDIIFERVFDNMIV